MVLDAGPTSIGIESTVLDLTHDPPQILRPGGITCEELRAILGKVSIHPTAIARSAIHVEQTRSPGVKYRHYAPKAEMVVVEGELCSVVMKIKELAEHYVKAGRKVGILATDESSREYNLGIVKSMGSRRNLALPARNLFKLLREFDEEGVNIIIAEGFPQEDLGLAIMNRLRKAAGYNIITV
jgi:L-threonylcarbamoyladenylate synthase